MDLNKIDLNLLVLFETVYSSGGIGKAAGRLNITQPAVSNGLRRLRELMDDPLFVRSSGGVEPTVKATQLIGPVREALGIISRQLGTGGSIELATHKRHFRIVMVDVLEPIVMPPIVRLIDRHAPGITIEALVGTRSFAEELRTGTVDLACFAFAPHDPEIRSVPIARYDLVVVARRGHPGIKGKLDAETFRSLSFVVLAREIRGLTNVDKDFADNFLSRRAPYAVSKLWSAPAMVERTDLVALLPRRFAEYAAERYALDIHELPVPFADQRMYLQWHERNEADPGHRWLREAMIEAAKETPLETAVAVGTVVPMPGGGRRKLR